MKKIIGISYFAENTCEKSTYIDIDKCGEPKGLDDVCIFVQSFNQRINSSLDFVYSNLMNINDCDIESDFISSDNDIECESSKNWKLPIIHLLMTVVFCGPSVLSVFGAAEDGLEYSEHAKLCWVFLSYCLVEYIYKIALKDED